MPIPAIIGLIGSVLGRKKDQPQGYEMQSSKFGQMSDLGNGGQLPGTSPEDDGEMVWDEKQKRYVRIGFNSRLQSMQQGSQGQGIGGIMDTAQTIGSIVNRNRGA